MPIHHYFIYENFLIKLNVKLKLSKILCENSFNTDIAFIYFKIKTLFSHKYHIPNDVKIL